MLLKQPQSENGQKMYLRSQYHRAGNFDNGTNWLSQLVTDNNFIDKYGQVHVMRQTFHILCTREYQPFIPSPNDRDGLLSGQSIAATTPQVLKELYVWLSDWQSQRF